MSKCLRGSKANQVQTQDLLAAALHPLLALHLAFAVWIEIFSFLSSPFPRYHFPARPNLWTSCLTLHHRGSWHWRTSKVIIAIIIIVIIIVTIIIIVNAHLLLLYLLVMLMPLGC
jgi:hypothetical protein